MAKCLPKHSERLRKLLKKTGPWILGDEQQKNFGKTKQILTEVQCRALYAKDEDNKVSTELARTVSE